MNQNPANYSNERSNHLRKEYVSILEALIESRRGELVEDAMISIHAIYAVAAAFHTKWLEKVSRGTIEAIIQNEEFFDIGKTAFEAADKHLKKLVTQYDPARN